MANSLLYQPVINMNDILISDLEDLCKLLPRYPSEYQYTEHVLEIMRLEDRLKLAEYLRSALEVLRNNQTMEALTELRNYIDGDNQCFMP